MRFNKNMSMFGDYKSYKTFAPQYAEWKQARNVAEAKRVEYLKRNPNAINPEDIQKSRALLRAVDIMDEFSQKKAENMEVFTESVVNTGMEIALTIGSLLGMLATQLKPIKQKFAGNKKMEMIVMVVSMMTGALLSTVAAFPLFAWAAKAEVKAARKGRFQAMREELNSPNTFAILTPEQEKKLEEITTKTPIKEKKDLGGKFREKWQNLKEFATETDEYLIQKYEFESKLAENEKHFDEKLTDKEIEDAKKDQQLLTKLIEKIDIASQDYAENAELATTAVITTGFALGSLITLLYDKVAKLLKLKSSSALPAGIGYGLMLVASIFGSQIQKQAARVGRFKVKQELMKNPEQLVYVSDEKTGEITDVEVNLEKKDGIFKFLRNAWKNNKEFEKWKKTEGAFEKNTAKAMEQLELSEEQLKDARRLQHNTFKTFNKVDENSQKYAESIEALGQSIQQPISVIFSTIGVLLGAKYLTKAASVKKNTDMIGPMLKYVSIVLLSTLPTLGINAYVTKEQKKASRVADMLAIDEMQDYKNFADYSRFKDK